MPHSTRVSAPGYTKMATQRERATSRREHRAAKCRPSASATRGRGTEGAQFRAYTCWPPHITDPFLDLLGARRHPPCISDQSVKSCGNRNYLQTDGVSQGRVMRWARSSGASAAWPEPILSNPSLAAMHRARGGELERHGDRPVASAALWEHGTETTLVVGSVRAAGAPLSPPQSFEFHLDCVSTRLRVFISEYAAAR